MNAAGFAFRVIYDEHSSYNAARFLGEAIKILFRLRFNVSKQMTERNLPTLC
jgi:hypothetical protein